MQDFINFISPYIINLGNWNYFLVFISIFLETLIGIAWFFPGTTIIILISFFSLQSGLCIKLIFLYTFLGSFFGVIINYFLGLQYGKKCMKEGLWFIKPAIFKKTQNIIKNHPKKSLILGRITPGIKETISFVAGMAHINFLKFLFYITIGTIFWALAFIGIPYLFSFSLEITQIWLGRFSYFIFILFLILVFFSLLKFLFSIYFKDIYNFFSEIFNIFKNYFFKQKIIKYFIAKYPKSTLFIKNRFKKNKFEGFTLTILSLLIFYTIFAFLGFIENILNLEIIIGLDKRLNSFFYAFRNDVLINIFLGITSFGKAGIIFGFTILVSIFLYLYNKKAEIIALLTSIIGSILLTNLLKNIFQHTRPKFPVYIENSYSFPSGHSTIAIAFYGFLFWLAIRSSKKNKRKINLFFIGIFIIFLIGFSRLYLGVHYLSDVLGGYFIGSIWLFFAILLTEFLNIKFFKQKFFFNFNKKNFLIYFIKNNKNIKNIKKLEIFTKSIFIFIGIIFFIIYNFYTTYKIVNFNFDNEKIKNINNLSEIFKNYKLKYGETFTGFPTENINFIFLAKNDKIIEKSFLKSLWTDADKFNYYSSKMMLKNLLFQKSYETAPITPLFWNNKTQNFSFQKLPNKKDIRYRHHIRIWKTNFKYKKYNIYIGIGIYDEGLKYKITHKINPDLDKEREYIFNSLKENNFIKNYKKIQLVKKYIGKNIFNDEFFTDGKTYVLELKNAN